MGIFDALFKPDVEMLHRKRDVKGLVKALRYWRDENVREKAAAVLVRIGTPAVEPLIVALKDEYKDVRREAAEVLVRIGTPAVEPLIAALKDEDAYGRWEAAEALGKIKDPRAVGPLIAALRDKNERVRREAIDALGKIKDPRAVEPLIAALGSGSNVQSSAEEALIKIGTPAVEPLIVALKDKYDKDLRMAAAYALGKIKDPRAVEPLIGVLKVDRASDVRMRAAYALGEIKDPRAVEPLIAARKYENSDVRKAAAYALGEIKDARAVAALRDKDRDVRRKAAGALGEIKDPIKRLREFLTKYERGFNTPGGFDASDMKDYIKCIEEVANLGTEDAISALKEVEADPCYAEIAIAVELCLRKLGRKTPPRTAYEPRELDSNYRSKNITEDFVLHLKQAMINLPITPDAFRDSFGDLEDRCRICKTIKEACTYVISFLKEREEAVDGFHNLRTESLGKDMIRVIFFLYEGGMEVFGSMNIARIGKDEYILKR